MRFLTLFDNYQYDKELQSLWGFSCLIELDNGKNILLDTGSNGRVLLKNAKKMGVDFKKIDTLFITHNHWDHIGGIDTIIEENSNIKLIVPNSLSKHLIKDLKTMVKEVVIIDSNFTQFDKNLYSTGIMNPIGEQTLIIKRDNKLFIVTGCGHSGIDNIEKRVLENLNYEVEYILGGFHLLRSSPKEINLVLDRVKTNFITATHCTGDNAKGIFKKFYGKKFLKNGVGAIVEF